MQAYYQRKIMCGDNFLCESYDECRLPKSKGMHFYEGQLSHIGKKFDVVKDGKPLRIVISGIEYGEKNPRVDLPARFEQIAIHSGMGSEFKANDNGRGHRNPHMRGTTLILKRILLGEDSVNSERHPLWSEEFVGSAKTSDNHIFNMFALVNFLLCSRVKNSMNGHSKRTMRRSCYHHYFQTLQILEPNLLVLQTKGKLAEMLKDLNLVDYWKPEHGSSAIGRFRKGKLDFLTCEFTHPAYPGPEGNWSGQNREYFQDTVLPTIGKAMQILELE